MKPDINSPGQLEATQKPVEKEPENLPTPEQAMDKVGEQPITSAGLTQATNTTAAQQPVTQPAVTTQQPVTQPTVTGTAKDQFESQLAQLPAEDSDVIEKVWVDKADEIVDKTKDDPYLEDEAQHSLSRAYLKKRFNLDVD